MAYEIEAWGDFFVASAGAAAALAGLVFVAVSINLERILLFQGLPERALETVLLLLSAVIVSLVGLIPGQSHVALGIELLAVSLALGLTITLLARRRPGSAEEPWQWRRNRLFLRAIGTLPLIVGGAAVLAETGGGLYWIAGGVIGAILGGVANAWVLLVEILR